MHILHLGSSAFEDWLINLDHLDEESFAGWDIEDWSVDDLGDHDDHDIDGSQNDKDDFEEEIKMKTKEHKYDNYYFDDDEDFIENVNHEITKVLEEEENDELEKWTWRKLKVDDDETSSQRQQEEKFNTIKRLNEMFQKVNVVVEENTHNEHFQIMKKAAEVDQMLDMIRTQMKNRSFTFDEMKAVKKQIDVKEEQGSPSNSARTAKNVPFLGLVLAVINASLG